MASQVQIVQLLMSLSETRHQPWTIATVTALCPYIKTKERLCLLKQGCQVASTLSNQAAHQIITMMPVVMAKVAMIATNL
jgi:hypothetical protein